MEWDPTERDAWVPDAQRWISRITGVLDCKIDLDDSGEVSGIHVVAGMDRDPRHIVRDVEGLLKARLDLDVFYKKIGVVQVLDNAGSPAAAMGATTASPAASPAETATSDSEGQSVPGSQVRFYPGNGKTADPEPESAPATENSPEPSPEVAAEGDAPPPVPAILVAEDLAPRVICQGVGLMVAEATSRAEVRLRLGDVEVEGVREGANHADSDVRLLAEASLAAVNELIVDPVLLHLKEVRIQMVGGQSVVLTAIDLVEGRQSQTLFGTCPTRHNRQQAVVFAVLDALNRRLALHGLKTLGAEG